MTVPGAQVVVIPCGRWKLDKPAPAAAFYAGGQFRLALRAAVQLTAERPGLLLILSAKHGLLRPDDIIAPYDMTIGHPDAIAPATVRGQTAALIPPGTAVVSLLPAGYAALLNAALLDTAVPAARHVLAGTRGIGEQRGRLARIVRDGWAALDVPAPAGTASPGRPPAAGTSPFTVPNQEGPHHR